jgi:hypothetical protein
MKVGLITSTRGKKMYGHLYDSILQHLQKKGHDVLHTLELVEEEVYQHSIEWREKFFLDFYKKLDKVDIVVAETSFPSANVGYGVSYVVQHGKPIIVLHTKETEHENYWLSDIASRLENVVVHPYEENELLETLEYALLLAEEKADKRFTIIFPGSLMNKLEDYSRKKRIPKAVYVRQLVEKGLAAEKLV